MFEFIAKLFSEKLEELIRTRMSTALAHLEAKDPKAYKTVLTSMYPVIDVQLEDITDKSKTKVDDVIVDGLKGGFEVAAAKSGVTLPNLDSD